MRLCTDVHSSRALGVPCECVHTDANRFVILIFHMRPSLAWGVGVPAISQGHGLPSDEICVVSPSRAPGHFTRPGAATFSLYTHLLTHHAS